MARLTVLNGAPGIGKSTLAARYVESHAGVLNLDIDVVGSLIGGWRDDFSATVATARTDALALAAGHLGQGLDVVVPQFIGRVSQLERFEAVARDAGAGFRHIVLMDTRDSVAERLSQRGRRGETEWHRQAERIVESNGGETAIGAVYDAIADVVRERLTSVLVTSEPGAVESTYGALVEVMDRGISVTRPRAASVVVRDDRVLVIKRRRQGIEYAVLPGGGIERGETAREAALRELHEETTLSAGKARELWHRHDSAREATYFLCSDVAGTAILSGEESLEHSPANSFALAWVGAESFDEIGLQPHGIRELVRELLAPSTS